MFFYGLLVGILVTVIAVILAIRSFNKNPPNFWR